MAPSSTMGAVIPLNLRRRRRWWSSSAHGGPAPGGDGRAEPGLQRRAILVDAPVSSTKTSLSGSRAGWASNQARRRCSTSGRCCSLACAVFLKVIPRRWKKRHTVLWETRSPCSLSRWAAISASIMSGARGLTRAQRREALYFDQRQDEARRCPHLGPCLDPLRAPVATLWPGPIAARCSLPGPNPLDRRRRRDPEALGRSPRRGPGRGHCTLEYPITVCCLGRPYARLEPEQEDRRGTLLESLQAEDASTPPATGAFDEAATGLALLFGRDSARLDLDSACSS